MSLKIVADGPPVIAALGLTDFGKARGLPVQWLEDYAAANARVFAQAAAPLLMLQVEARIDRPASIETLAFTAALARLLRADAPKIRLGIVVEAHEPAVALSIAHASGAGFERLAVFVGGAMTAPRPRRGLGAAALAHRAAPGRSDIAVLADVHDRTCAPLSSEPQSVAAEWAVETGADGLTATGSSCADTLACTAAARAGSLRRPARIGGDVTVTNVAPAPRAACGVIVRRASMRENAGSGDLSRRDADLCRRFADTARAA